MWPRYSELADNRRYFFARARGERSTCAKSCRTACGLLIGTAWGNKVLKKYPEWLRRIEKNRSINSPVISGVGVTVTETGCTGPFLLPCRVRMGADAAGPVPGAVFILNQI